MHKHKWLFMGLTINGPHHGMAHRLCKCGADLYSPATKQEKKKHDPHNEIESEAKR